ncbi:hypothetical protein [Saccharopolyspora rosea]|uniref:DUF8017 domain-containing protein n=1 Tax=Saccharopolyspora rosea TaxID=524884 RepID=A0ABW3FTZ3_9PSEU|nr:hypothetical protein [Saccharopolyspora rosea]
MSSPGGNWGPHQPGQQYDPSTGQPAHGRPAGFQPGQYQGFGAFDQRQQQPYPGMVTGYPGQRRRRTGMVIAAVSLAAVAVVAIVTTVVVLNTGSRRGQAQRPVGSPTTSATSAPASSAETSSAPAAVPAIVPGWQAVPVPKRGAVYDAPQDWTLETPDDIIGFGPADDPVTMTGVSVYKKGFCPGKSSSYRAIAGATARKGPSDAAVATATAQKFADLAYSAGDRKPQVAMGPAEPVQLPGGIAASRVTATVTHPAPGPCDAPTEAVTVIATNNDGQASVVFLGTAEQNAPDTLPDPTGTLQRMAMSFRRAA